MLLVINSNNTNTVFGAFDYATGEKLASWRISTDPKRTADEYAVWLTHLMALQSMTLAQISGVVVSNVVPQAMFNLRDFCRRYAKAEPVIVGEKGLKYGLEIRIDRPEEAGADRIANAVGARTRYKMPGVVGRSGHRHHLRRAGRSWQLLRRHDQPRHQSRFRSPLYGGGETAAHRDPPPGAHHRHVHRGRRCSPAFSGAMSA